MRSDVPALQRFSHAEMVQALQRPFKPKQGSHAGVLQWVKTANRSPGKSWTAPGVIEWDTWSWGLELQNIWQWDAKSFFWLFLFFVKLILRAQAEIVEALHAGDRWGGCVCLCGYFLGGYTLLEIFCDKSLSEMFLQVLYTWKYLLWLTVALYVESSPQNSEHMDTRRYLGPEWTNDLTLSIF